MWLGLFHALVIRLTNSRLKSIAPTFNLNSGTRDDPDIHKTQSQDVYILLTNSRQEDQGDTSMIEVGLANCK